MAVMPAPPAVVVNLTAEEIEFVAIAGAMRRVNGIRRNARDRYGAVDVDPWGIDIEGAAAELAVAKTLDRYWTPGLHVQRVGEGDVADYQVRSTTRENGSLLIKDGDRDKDIFVLVIGRIPTLRVVGWARAGCCRLPEWRREVRGRQAFFVPQWALELMERMP